MRPSCVWRVTNVISFLTKTFIAPVSLSSLYYPSPAWQVQFTRSDEIESVNKTIIHDIWHCIYYYYVLAIGHDKEFFGCALYYYIYILLEEGNLSAYFVLLLRTIYYVNDHTVWSMNHIHCNWWKYPIPFHLQDIWMKYILWIFSLSSTCPFLMGSVKIIAL